MPMTGKKTAPKKRKGKFSIVTALICVLVAVSLIGLAVLGWWVMKQDAEVKQKTEAREAAKEAAKEAHENYLATHPYPRTLVDDSVAATVKAAAANGWIPCPGDCLKLATPGWHRQDLAGFAPTDWWFSFRYPGGTSYYSQRHAGHIIRNDGNRPAEDAGLCPICGGSGWVRKE
jgi:hypothetical protein